MTSQEIIFSSINVIIVTIVHCLEEKTKCVILIAFCTNDAISVLTAVWPDDQIICSIFGLLQQWKFTH